jgi:preprotein translocase subunit SecY
VRPGAHTAQFLDFVMTRITFAGAVFLTAIALLPDLLYFAIHIPYGVALFFGGTGTLITVGVLLEMMRQVETFLVQRNYDGFMKKAHNKYSGKPLSICLNSDERRAIRLLFGVMVFLLVAGFVVWGVRVSRHN